MKRIIRSITLLMEKKLFKLSVIFILLLLATSAFGWLISETDRHFDRPPIIDWIPAWLMMSALSGIIIGASYTCLVKVFGIKNNLRIWYPSIYSSVAVIPLFLIWNSLSQNSLNIPMGIPSFLTIIIVSTLTFIFIKGSSGIMGAAKALCKFE